VPCGCSRTGSASRDPVNGHASRAPAGRGCRAGCAPRRFRPGLRRIEFQPGQADRDTVSSHRRRAVQVQPRHTLAVPVAAHHAQTLTARMGGKVQVGAVLNRQHRRPGRNPFPRTPAMHRRQVLHRDRGFRRLLQHPVVTSDRRRRKRGTRLRETPPPRRFTDPGPARREQGNTRVPLPVHEGLDRHRAIAAVCRKIRPESAQGPGQYP